MLSDAQLWSAAALAQYVRSILPLGEIWNPIIDNLVYMISVLQDANLKKVAFYVETTAFVNWLHSKDLFPSLRVTGHSLGVRQVLFCLFRHTWTVMLILTSSSLPYINCCSHREGWQ